MKDKIKTFFVMVALIPFLLIGWLVTLVKGEGWEDK